MFKKKEVPFEKVDTLIGLGTHFQGVITSKGTLRIDGTFKGEIKIEGDLVVGDDGVLEASVEARNVLVSGEIKGNLIVKDKVEITPTGKVFGDIKVDKLIIDEGAVFKGACLMEAAQTKNSKKVHIEEAAK